MFIVTVFKTKKVESLGIMVCERTYKTESGKNRYAKKMSEQEDYVVEVVDTDIDEDNMLEVWVHGKCTII